MIRHLDYVDLDFTKYFFLVKSFILILVEIYRISSLVHLEYSNRYKISRTNDNLISLKKS